MGEGDGPLLVLTPGGRYGKDIPGLRPLADALVAGGLRVLLWDRPNCGASEVQFFALTESHMRVDTLHGLLQEIGVESLIVAGGSGGARASMLMAMQYPEMVSKLAVWNIVGGSYGVYNLGSIYALPTIKACRRGGIPDVIELADWKEVISANPKNLARFESFEAEELESIMYRWLNAYISKPGQTIPGIDDWMFERIKIPTLIIRGGEKDIDHPKRTSLEVSCLIKGSKVIDPPWPEDAWEQSIKEMSKTGRFGIFDTWVKAAPALLEFFKA